MRRRRHGLRGILIVLWCIDLLAVASGQAVSSRLIPEDNLSYPVLIRIGTTSGSGFYLATGEDVFLVTAAHVLFEPDRRTLIAVQAEALSYASDPKERTQAVFRLDLKALNENGSIKIDTPHDVAVVRVARVTRLGAAMTSGHNTYFKAGAAASVSSDHETRVGVMNAMLMINQPAGDRGFLSNQSYYVDNKPGAVIPPMTWGCVEAFFDPAHSTVDFWLDGKELADLHRTDWQQDPIGAFRFGFEKYAGPAIDIWYDDIAIGTERIGCQ